MCPTGWPAAGCMSAATSKPTAELQRTAAGMLYNAERRRPPLCSAGWPVVSKLSQAGREALQEEDTPQRKPPPAASALDGICHDPGRADGQQRRRTCAVPRESCRSVCEVEAQLAGLSVFGTLGRPLVLAPRLSGGMRRARQATARGHAESGCPWTPSASVPACSRRSLLRAEFLRSRWSRNAIPHSSAPICLVFRVSVSTGANGEDMSARAAFIVLPPSPDPLFPIPERRNPSLACRSRASEGRIAFIDRYRGFTPEIPDAALQVANRSLYSAPPLRSICSQHITQSAKENPMTTSVHN